METIQKIEDTTFSQASGSEEWRYERRFEGFVITTDKQVIKIGVSNDQDCCESWGHFTTVDNLDDFIGARLNGVSVTDTALNTKKVETELPYGLDEGGIMYVNLDTDRGILQFAAYNSHNGYYGHTGIVISEQLQHEATL